MGKAGPSVRSWRVVHGGNLDAPLLEEGRRKHERSLAFYVVILEKAYVFTCIHSAPKYTYDT